MVTKVEISIPAGKSVVDVQAALQAQLCGSAVPPECEVTQSASRLRQLLLLPSAHLLNDDRQLTSGGSRQLASGNTTMGRSTRQLIAGSASFALFTGFANQTFLASLQPEVPRVGVLARAHIEYMAYAVPLGVLCGLVGLTGIALLGVGNQVGTRVKDALDGVGARYGCRRHLGMVVAPAIGGALLGLMAVACPLTMGDGNAQLGAVVKQAFLAEANRTLPDTNHTLPAAVPNISAETLLNEGFLIIL